MAEAARDRQPTLGVAPPITAGEPAPEALQVVLFRAGGVLFAVPASEVEQARRRDDDRAAGVDLAAALGGRTRDGGGLMLIVRHQGNHLRLLADEVLKVAALPLAVIYPLPRLVAESQRGGYVSGVAICGDELALLLDPGALERETSAAAVAGQAPGGIEG